MNETLRTDSFLSDFHQNVVHGWTCPDHISLSGHGHMVNLSVFLFVSTLPSIFFLLVFVWVWCDRGKPIKRSPYTVTVTQPETITIDHACMEGADRFLAEAGVGGQAVGPQSRDWRQGKQSASRFICHLLPGPLHWHGAKREHLAVGEGCLSSSAKTISEATAWRVCVCVSVCVCVCGSRGAVRHLQAAELHRCQQGQTIPRIHWPQFPGGAGWVCVCPGK